MNAHDREKVWQLELQRATHQCPQCATVWLVPAEPREGQLACKTCGHRAPRQTVMLPAKLRAAPPPPSWQLRAA